MTKPKQTVVDVEPLLYSMDQTCVRLGIGKTKLYAEMSAGDLEYVEIGDRRFTTEEQQRAFVARKTVRAA